MTRYELLVGEPWDFEGPDGPNRLLVDFGGFTPGLNRADEFILLKAVMPFQHNNKLVEFMIASPRKMRYLKATFAVPAARIIKIFV